MSKAKQHILNLLQPDKFQLRKLFKEARQNRHNFLEKNLEEKESTLRKLEENLFTIIGDHSKNLDSLNICCYSPIKDEINILPSILKFKKIYENENVPFKIGLPKTYEFERAMKFYEYKEGFLITGKYNIKEPDSSICEEITPYIIITPLLAFDHFKHRLGYGKGYYDNTFLKLKTEGKNFVSIGIAYDEQFYDGDLPIDQYDQHLSYVVTPNRVY